ncbi:LLM class flavin-dependent oxidoreductase [Streptomyces albofaciens JCM 4342]|uniref:LLM class flavin-dependent oxidoreductase n=1 Tax=Streptomyces albofaciens TaxID=66866 RepID=UPI0012395AE3|nr:LLM class flavin-dependent oxidoreductase [Streptomyces albofaciens]KAA6224457.1 LLM class flavin-dependent oxidoreductase [Streptomyces albofaciens JCM 4342]
MEHGISLLPDCRPEQRTPAEYYRDAIAISKFSDDAGLGYVKMTEHYLGDYGGYCPSPLTFLTAVAAQTSRIRLMTGALLPAFHHPIQLAAHIAQVDAISGGRVDAGFGRAWLPYEFDAFKVPMDESRARYEATIEAVVRLWTEEKVSENTPFFSYTDATSLPPVTQRPHPPVWGAAVKSPESFTWLATKGFGVMLALAPARQYTSVSRHLVDHYREVFTATHGTTRTPRIAMSTPLYIARTDAEAYRLAEPFYREYLRVWTEAARSWRDTSSSGYVGYESMGRDMKHLGSFDVKRYGTAVIGSPESAVEQIHELHETYGADTYLWNVDFGGQNYEQMHASMKLFVDEVLPKL